MQPGGRGIEVIRAVAGSEDGRWSSEALARASMAASYLDLSAAGELAARSAARAAGDRDQAYARRAAGWVHACRHQQAAAPGCLDQVIAYAQAAAGPWLEASAWQARGLVRGQTADAFRDWQQAAVRFAAAGDVMHAGNVRYMMAHRAVQAGERPGEVPAWLEECESYPARHGYRHELARIHHARAVHERMQGRPGAARELVDGSLPVFRQAGDFRCTTRTLPELAGHHRPGAPGAAAGPLLQGRGMAMLAGGGSLCARVLAILTTAAAAAGDLPLAARAFGALEALGPPQAQAGTADARPAVPADLSSALQAHACAAYAEEGRAGGTSLIITLTPAVTSCRRQPTRGCGDSTNAAPYLRNAAATAPPCPATTMEAAASRRTLDGADLSRQQGPHLNATMNGSSGRHTPHGRPPLRLLRVGNLSRVGPS